MFNHILMTLDGSGYSERVLAYAADLAAPSSARVTLLIVAEAPASPGADEAAPTEGQVQECGDYLERHRQALFEAGLTEVSTDVRSGAAARSILEAARELGVDLIAMSTQGVGAESEEGLGSIASRVLRAAPCPVFMVRVERPEPPRSAAEERWQSEGGANVG